MVSLTHTALRLLNGAQASIRPEIVRADARIIGQRTNRGLVDVKHIPIMQAASPHISDGCGRVPSRELLLEGHVPVPPCRRYQVAVHRSDRDDRFYAVRYPGAGIVDRDVVDYDGRLERRVAAGENVVDDPLILHKSSASQADHGIWI